MYPGIGIMSACIAQRAHSSNKLEKSLQKSLKVLRIFPYLFSVSISNKLFYRKIIPKIIKSSARIFSYLFTSTMRYIVIDFIFHIFLE